MTVRRLDLSGEPCRLRPNQWSRSARRDPSAMLGVVLHEWASPVGTVAAERRAHGEALALARRGLAAPYNLDAGVTRSGEPVVALCHPLARYTFASDAACGRYVSLSVMGLFPFEESGRAARHTPVTNALRAAVADALAWAAEMLAPLRPDDAPPLNLVTHRQAINGRGDHECCPGEAVVAMALESPAVRAGIYRPLPDAVFVERWGRPWPASWRRHLPDDMLVA